MKTIWLAIDGKKTVTGILVLLLTAVAKIIKMRYPAIGAMLTDETILGIATGAATLIGVGLTHKAVKKVKTGKSSGGAK